MLVDYDQADWGSTTRYADGDLTGLWVPDKAVVHWGGLTDPPRTIPGEMALLQSWQRYHINNKGWRDIAYNYGVGNSGSSYRLRGWNPSGATRGDFEGDGIKENNEAVAIVWLGGSRGVPTNAAFATMTRLINEAHAVIDAPPLVIGHRDVKGNTTCPGAIWSQWIKERRWDIPPPPDPPEEDDIIVIIEALQAQTTAWYQALQAQTGTPAGDPAYWGSDGMAGDPSDQEWNDAAPALFAAALQAGVVHPAAAPPVGVEVDTVEVVKEVRFLTNLP